MRTFIARLSVLCTVALLALTPAFARVTQAQDTMMTHTCDSTLITLLFIAESDYGFHSMMDVTSFDKGQYAPLFEAMMANMDMGDSMMQPTEEMMAEGDMMTEDSTMMQGDMMMLTPGIVADEDPACTDLRAELEAFFYTEFSADMAM
jgi:hypothetical protein